MKKRILFIIIILILVAIGIVGSLYFISYKNDSQAKNEDENSMPENIINSIIDDTNAVSNEVESNLNEQNIENTITEVGNESPETSETKETTQTTTQTFTKTTSSPSNNNQSSQKKETGTKSTTTPNTTTQKNISSTSQSSSSESSKQETTKIEPKVERCTNNNNHSLGIGNSGKWFSSKDDAIAYYNQQTKYWGDKWENNELNNNDEYYKNCPSGYEVWDCMYCGKWTINFYYR